MGLFENLRLSLAKRGKLRLKDWAERYGDDDEFVKACIKGRGVAEFQHAGEWIRSDAEFILKMISEKPEILQYCSDIVYDRYFTEDGIFMEEEMDQFWFSVKCCQKNLMAYKFINNFDAKKYFHAVKDSKLITGTFHGEEESVQLENDRHMLDALLYVRHGIVKLNQSI